MNRSAGHSNRVNREAVLGVFVCTGSDSFSMNPENKGPKGPHIMHLSTMYHFLTDWPGWPSCFYDRSEKHKLGRRH